MFRSRCIVVALYTKGKEGGEGKFMEILRRFVECFVVSCSPPHDRTRQRLCTRKTKLNSSPQSCEEIQRSRTQIGFAYQFTN
jgi:hypothetical protein